MRPLSLAAAAAFALCLSACAPGYPDDRFVAVVSSMRPSVVLLTMRVPPEHKGDRFDEAYATGTVIASGAWGSDVLTVAHAVDGAWDMHVTIGNREKVAAHTVAMNKDLDVALVRIARGGLATQHLGDSRDLGRQLGREVGLLGYPIPDEFDDESLGLATSVDTGRLSSVRKGALEVSLPIVPGESGGPVFLADTGEIIGSAESRFDDEHSIGFALPVNDAKGFLHKTDAAHGF